MSLTVQKGFWQDNVIANTRLKVAELYRDNPDIMKSEKRCILEFWSRYEGLEVVLGDSLGKFEDWFIGATSPETITRCLRGLKEDGTIELTARGKAQRLEREKTWHSYWGNQKHQNAKWGLVNEG